MALAAVAAVGAVGLAALTAHVDGTSMQPTLADGDLLLIDRLGPHFQAPARGDLVVIGLNPHGLAGVKRVIGVPGDALEIDGMHEDAPGGRPHPVVLLRPGGAGPWQRLVEPYVASDWGRPEVCCNANGLSLDIGREPAPVLLPPGEFFVLGDNRGTSIDSRTFGLVPRDRIVAQVLVRYWPLDRSGVPTSAVKLVPA